MKFIDQKQTIRQLTEKMSNKERFAFVTFSRSSFLSITGQILDDKKLNKYFTKSISNSLEIKNKNYMRSLYYGMISESTDIDISKIPSISNEYFYDAATLENMFLKKRDVFDSFVNFYIKYSNTLVISFYDMRHVQKIIGSPTYHIKVSYNDYHEKIDDILSSVQNLGPEVDYCIMGCPTLSAALSGHIWNKTSMSILDFGKIFTVSSYKTNV
jgi:hypothetical protein